MAAVRVGFALTGSFCTFDKAIEQMKLLVEHGYEVHPIMSLSARNIDTRFGQAQEFVDKIERICGREVLDTLVKVEPIGPHKMFDVLVIIPCTGNTLAKIANGITDTPVAMAVKSHLRNSRPVVLGVSTNDALSGSAKNIGLLLNTKHIYFLPMAQDDPQNKPRSVIAKFDLLEEAIKAALENRQIQPIYTS